MKDIIRAVYVMTVISFSLRGAGFEEGETVCEVGPQAQRWYGYMRCGYTGEIKAQPH